MELSVHLVSDLDGTWIPPDGEILSLRALEDFLSGVPRLTLTFATGRTFRSAATELARIVKLWPTFLVTDVGTGIHRRTPDGQWVEDDEYGAMIGARWDADAARRICEALAGRVRRQPGLEATRRLALEVLTGFDLRQAADELTHLCHTQGFAADVLPSNLTCLDVLPKGVTKGTAIEYLHRHIPSPSRLVACGDSENDLGMLRLADVAIIMTNSPLSEDSVGVPRSRVFRPAAPGPAGIHDVLSSLRLVWSRPAGGTGNRGGER